MQRKTQREVSFRVVVDLIKTFSRAIEHLVACFTWFFSLLYSLADSSIPQNAVKSTRESSCMTLWEEEQQQQATNNSLFNYNFIWSFKDFFSFSFLRNFVRSFVLYSTQHKTVCKIWFIELWAEENSSFVCFLIKTKIALIDRILLCFSGRGYLGLGKNLISRFLWKLFGKKNIGFVSGSSFLRRRMIWKTFEVALGVGWWKMN